MQMPAEYLKEGDFMPEASKEEVLKEVTIQVRALFHKLGHAATVIHGTDIPAIGKRAILEDLLINGQQTIPEIARKRPVSRQHILQLVKPLEEEGNVQFKENPIHKKSFLVDLTDQGKELIEEMILKEGIVFKELTNSMKLSDLNTTLKTLSSIKELLDSEKFTKEVEDANE